MVFSSKLKSILVLVLLAPLICVFGQAPDVLGHALRIPLQQQATQIADPGPPPALTWDQKVEQAESRAQEAEQAHKDAQQNLSEATSNRDAAAQAAAQEATNGAAF